MKVNNLLYVELLFFSASGVVILGHNLRVTYAEEIYSFKQIIVQRMEKKE